MQNSEPVNKRKKDDLLCDIIMILIAEGHFYDEKTERPNPDSNPEYRFYNSRDPSSKTDYNCVKL